MDDVTAERSSRMKSEVYRAELSALIQPNAAKPTGRSFTVQMDNDTKRTVEATQELLKAKTENILRWPSQSPDRNPM